MKIKPHDPAFFLFLETGVANGEKSDVLYSRIDG
jgi:hypothetical protein